MLRSSATQTDSKKVRALRAYRKAIAEYKALMNYIEAAVKFLPKPECELLSEFAEIAKGKCERLHRAAQRLSGRSAA